MIKDRKKQAAVSVVTALTAVSAVGMVLAQQPTRAGAADEVVRVRGLPPWATGGVVSKTTPAPHPCNPPHTGVVASEGSDNSLDFAWEDDSGTWHGEQVAGAGTTYSTPAITRTSTGVVIAAEGPNNDLVFYWQLNGAPTWSNAPEQVAGSGSTYSAPSIVWTGQSVEISAEGPMHSIDYYWQQSGTPAWSNAPEVVAGWGAASGQPAIAWTGNATVVAATADDGSVWAYTQPIGAPNWDATPSEVAGPGSASSPASAASVEGQTGIAYEAGDGSLHFALQPSWGESPQQVAGAGAAAGGPTLTFACGSWIVTAPSTGGGIGVYEEPYATTTWYGDRGTVQVQDAHVSFSDQGAAVSDPPIQEDPVGNAIAAGLVGGILDVVRSVATEAAFEASEWITTEIAADLLDNIVVDPGDTGGGLDPIVPVDPGPGDGGLPPGGF